jgi:E3 ubiquitin-protein ligase RNF14
MACTNCRYEFCWSCLADYNNIRKDGNHRHVSSCKHYAPYHN